MTGNDNDPQEASRGEVWSSHKIEKRVEALQSIVDRTYDVGSVGLLQYVHNLTEFLDLERAVEVPDSIVTSISSFNSNQLNLGTARFFGSFVTRESRTTFSYCKDFQKHAELYLQCELLYTQLDYKWFCAAFGLELDDVLSTELHWLTILQKGEQAGAIIIDGSVELLATHTSEKAHQLGLGPGYANVLNVIYHGASGSGVNVHTTEAFSVALTQAPRLSSEYELVAQLGVYKLGAFIALMDQTLFELQEIGQPMFFDYLPTQMLIGREQEVLASVGGDQIPALGEVLVRAVELFHKHADPADPYCGYLFDVDPTKYLLPPEGAALDV